MTQVSGRHLDAQDDPEDDFDDDSQEFKYLTFKVGNEEYGIDIRNVLEIIGIQRITEVPDTLSFVRGVVNLRGTVIPVIDVRLRFQMEPQPYTDRTCIVVTQMRDITVGLIVDTVYEVVTILPDQVSAPPALYQGSHGRFIKGMGRLGDAVKILLDTEHLLFDEERQRLQKLPLA
jgi:purine-binding chemotaxis protein CheW